MDDDSKKTADIKRLFFGFEVQAAWIDPLPGGKVLKEENRHITLAFLGNQSLVQVQNDLRDFPKQAFNFGLAGICNNFLFLPKKSPRVVAGHIDWLDLKSFLSMHQNLKKWLSAHNYPIDHREPLPHITFARAPFSIQKWKKAFTPFPLMTKALHLYESLGSLTYSSLWNLPLLSPIEEIEHTADIAFHIRGKEIPQLFFNAQLALAFKFPPILAYFSKECTIQTLDDLIIGLNGIISEADGEIGCPFKAVSFHGALEEEKNGLLLWEMIVDV